MERDIYIGRLVKTGYSPANAASVVDSYYVAQDLDALEDHITAKEQALEVR